jgi:uncharacterized repeat protein (TIGR02543 family)
MLLSVKSNNGALGSVSGTLGGLHPTNTSVGLIANPASGYSLLSWTSGGANLGTNATLSFTLTKDTAITANFGKAGSYNLTAAGTLRDISGIKTVSHLTLTGIIDARDVQLMRDSMPALTELNLSGANVVAYEGEEGTMSGTYDYPTNEMPQYSFYSSSEGTGKTSLISVKLPASLTSIGSYAFAYCRGLSGSMTLPTGLTSIGASAFYNCSSLSGSLILPTGLTSIGSDAFANCSGLSGNLTLPEGLISIGNSVFANCRELSGSLILPAGLTSIGNDAFASCSGLSSLSLPAGLISIGDYAFYNCSGLSGSLTLPEGLTSIGSYAFANCSGLSGSLTLPEVSTSIGIGAFASCSGLSDSLILPENLTSIGSEAFAYCSGLSSLTLPADLTSIGDYAFYNCSGLSGDLTLPAGLTSIGSWAFYGCSGFTSVTNLSLTPQSISSDVFGNVSISSIALRVPATSLAAYQSAQVWRDFYPIAGGVTLRIEINNSAWGTVTGAANGWLPANAAVSLTAIPAQGYVFEGWTSGGASLGASDSLAFILTQDTVITAGFRPSGSVTIYTVTFNANGGSAVNQQTVAAGGKVPQVAAPTRSGYIFDGWCSDAALTSFWNFATGTVTGDMTLYARWRVQPATGVESHTLGVARVYPNPTSGVVIVESGGAEVLLYSLQGALLERTFGSHLDLSSYPSGVYVLKAGNKAARIVKQ